MVSADNQKVSFQIPARGAAIASICVNLVLVLVIGIILNISDIDFLSTLALALAVIAFIVQIMVFIYQASASTMQLARSEELHGSTMRALAAIEEKAEGTRQTVTTMSDQMLTAMLSKGFSANDSVQASDNSGGGNGPVDTVFRADTGAEAPTPLAYVPAPRAAVSAESRPVTAVEGEGGLAVLPLPIGKRMEEAVAALKEMKPNRLSTLSWIGRDYGAYGNAKPGRIGHGVDDKSVNREMYDLGLVKRVRAGWDPDVTVAVLTDKGKDAAALLLQNNLPAGTDQAVLDARERLAQYKEDAKRAARARETQLDDVPVEG